LLQDTVHMVVGGDTHAFVQVTLTTLQLLRAAIRSDDD